MDEIDPDDPDVYDAVAAVIADAEIPISLPPDEVMARLRRLQPAITNAVAEVPVLLPGRSYNVRVAMDSGRGRYIWHVAVDDMETGQVWYGEGYL